jgi:hypothetical protein
MLRTHKVSVFLNDGEMKKLKHLSNVAGSAPASYIRQALATHMLSHETELAKHAKAVAGALPGRPESPNSGRVGMTEMLLNYLIVNLSDGLSDAMVMSVEGKPWTPKQIAFGRAEMRRREAAGEVLCYRRHTKEEDGSITYHDPIYERRPTFEEMKAEHDREKATKLAAKEEDQ